MAFNMEIKGYTKTGFEVVIKQNFKNFGAAKDFIGSMGTLNLLPEKPDKPDETEYAQISHVALTKKDDGTLHMAYYHVNEKLETRYTHKYFDGEHDKSEFEQWSGLKVDDLPVKEDNDHPKRNVASAKKYLVALPATRALIRVTSFIKLDDGGYDKNHDVERYIMPKNNGSASPSNGHAPAKTNEPATLDNWKASDADKDSVRAFLVEEGLTEAEALGITPANDWNSFPDAMVAIMVIREKMDKKSPFSPVPGSGTAGFKDYQQRQAKAAEEPQTEAASANTKKEPKALEEIDF